MGRYRASTSGDPPEWSAPLTAGWLAGILVAQVPFQLGLEIGKVSLHKLGNGNFGHNILLSAGLALAGVIVIVGLLRGARHFSGGSRWEWRLQAASLLLLGASAALALACFLPVEPSARSVLFSVSVCLLGVWLLAAFAAIAASLLSPEQRALVRRRRARRRSPWVFNGAFWLVVFILLLARDLWSMGQIEDRSAGEQVLMIAGRLLTLSTFTVAALLFTHAMLALFPPGLRWIVITAAACLPAIIIADFAAGLYWQQSLLEVLNSFTLAGRFDVTQLLEAAGIKNTPFQVFLALLAVVALSALAYLGLLRVSLRMRIASHPARALVLLGILWLGTIGQQALSMVAMRKEVWQAEHAAFKIHLGLFGPEPGYETIEVQFVEHQTEEDAERLLAGPLPSLGRMPDIYIVMVETWRADSITPEIAPFLHEFRRTECQQFGHTLAGSNCTPVSWFTFFHSRLGIHWKQAVAQESEPGGLRGAYPLRLLHKLGYQHSVRAVCDLGYQQMADLNFGENHLLAATFFDNPMIVPRGLEIPEREVIVMDDLKKQLLTTPHGGHLHFLALDSPHYNYYWPEENFEPIHTDCAGNINYASLNPSAEDIRKVVKRYENAIHWIDAQMRDLVSFLKQHGRYDDSIIILTGDHGEEFQEHGGWFHCSNLKRPQIEVPIIVKWPSWVASQPPQKQATHLDVMPSVLDALGLDERYFANLAGRSLLREHPGEAVVSTLWAGVSGVGVCFVTDGMKANFAASRLWLGTVPTTLHFVGYSDLDDRPLDPLDTRGELTHSEFLRRTFPDVTSRHFSKFGALPNTKE